MELINKNLGSLRDQSATYRWAYYTPNPWALNDIAKLAQKGKVSLLVNWSFPTSILCHIMQQNTWVEKVKVKIQIKMDFAAYWVVPILFYISFY